MSVVYISSDLAFTIYFIIHSCENGQFSEVSFQRLGGSVTSQYGMLENVTESLTKYSGKVKKKTSFKEIHVRTDYRQ